MSKAEEENERGEQVLSALVFKQQEGGEEGKGTWLDGGQINEDATEQ